MDIDIIVTDLDGTLLTCKTWISKANYLALQSFYNQKGHICFLTGRCYCSTTKYLNKLVQKYHTFVRYNSCLKGSVIVDNDTKEIVYSNYISEDVVNSIIQICKKHKCAVGVYLVDDVFNKNMYVYGVRPIVKILNYIFRQKQYISFKEWTHHKKAYKINISGLSCKNQLWNHKKKLQNCYDEIISLYGNQIDVSFTSKFMYEITNKDCNKGEAVKFICNKLNIDLQRCAAFGDSANDIDMFKIVGLPIAVKQKNQELNNIAKHTIVNKQSKAVAIGINKYIFGKK